MVGPRASYLVVTSVPNTIGYAIRGGRIAAHPAPAVSAETDAEKAGEDRAGTLSGFRPRRHRDLAVEARPLAGIVATTITVTRRPDTGVDRGLGPGGTGATAGSARGPGAASAL